MVETAAVGRALADSGFGLQFADKEGDMDPEVYALTIIASNQTFTKTQHFGLQKTILFSTG